MNRRLLGIHFLLNIPSVLLFVLLLDEANVYMVPMFVISLIQLIGNISLLWLLQRSIFSFSLIFVVLSYIFHFGHLPLGAFNIEFGPNILFPLWYISEWVYTNAFIFTYLVQYFFTAGILITLMYKKNEKREELSCEKIIKWKERVSDTKLIQIGYAFLAIGILPSIYIEGSKLITYFTKGYLALFNLGFRDYMLVVSKCVEVGFMALMLGCSNDKRKGNIIAIIALAYQGVKMLSGSRGEAVCYAITYLIIWQAFIHKLNKKDYIKLITVCMVGLGVITVIASLRNVNFDKTTFVEVVVLIVTNNPIVNMLSEFGSTFAAVCFSINSFPEEAAPVYGLNYILPIVYIVPNIGGFNETVVNLSIFSNHYETFKQPTGGSYIGELYYSFNWLGTVMAVFLGGLVGYITRVIKKVESVKSKFLYLLLIQMIPYFLFWIRGYFGALYRGIIWHGALAIILLFIIETRWFQEKLEQGRRLWERTRRKSA